MQAVTYLNFDGKCEEAFRFYERVLGGTIEGIWKPGDMPGMEVGPEWGDRTMHATMRIGDTQIMASDSPPGQYVAPAGIYVSLHTADPAEAERVFAALSDGGNVQMELAETPWSPRFGMAVDRYGTPWMVNCDQEQGGA